MSDRNNDKIDLSRAYFLAKSKAYKHGGYKQAEFLTRKHSDFVSHLFAFLIDLNICLLPVYIWVIEFLLILCGLIPPNFFDLLFYIMYALLFVTSILGLGIFTAYTHGQSFGYVYTNLKLVDKNKREVSGLFLILRQAIGFGIPLMVIGYFFQVIGMIVWWAINAVCVCATPRQQTIADLLFKTMPVHEPPMSEKLEEETEEFIDEPIKVVKQQPEPSPAISSDLVSPIDLHLRSNYSDDGYYDVEDLFKQAYQLHMEVISITDHNCARANAAAVRFAPMYNIQYIPGVEIDTQWKGHRVRILGYYIDWTKDIFDEIERESLMREKQVSIERTQKFEDFCGIHIDVESLMQTSRFQTITAQDITKMVFHNKRVRELSFVKKYLESSKNETQARRRFARDVFGKGGPCYVTAIYPALGDMVKAIHDAGGIAILSSWNMDHIHDEEIETMMELGIDGIECFSPRIHEATMTSLLRIVKKHSAFVTCGSDFHGPNRPKFKMGHCCCPEKAWPLVRILSEALK